MIDWTLDCKTRSLAEASLGSTWIGRRDLRDFLMAMVGRREGNCELAVFAAQGRRRPVAGHIVSVDRTRVEGYISAFERTWSACSPGNVLT